MPHLRAVPAGYALDAWANILGDGGHQSGHIHNLGWLSGVYYVEMPAAVQDDDPERAGWIEFNRPGYGIPDLGRATVRALRWEDLWRGTTARLLHVVTIVATELMIYDGVKVLVGLGATGSF